MIMDQDQARLSKYLREKEEVERAITKAGWRSLKEFIKGEIEK